MDPNAIFPGDSELVARCRAFDWASTPLGPVEGWSHSLRTTVGIVLASRQPMFLFWGPALVQFHNDAYRPSLGAGGRADRALGALGREFWTDIWSVIGPQIEQVMTTGEATWHEDHHLPIERNGRLEDVWWTYSYSAVRDDDGSIAATLVVCQETTGRVRAERALVEERAHLSRLLEAAPAVMAVYSGPDQIITYVNPTWERVVGKPDAVGRPFREVFPEMAETGIFEQLTRVYETGEPYAVSELRLPIQRHPDGPLEDSYWDLLWQPQPGGAGTGPSGRGADILVHAVEVTSKVLARHAVEQLLQETERGAVALARSEAQYRSLFSSIDEGFLLAEVLYDATGQPVDLLYLEANPAAVRMTGIDYTGRRLREIDPRFEPHWLETWGRVAHTGVGERHEQYAGPLDSWFDFYVFPVGAPGAARVAVVFRNVTARKRRDANAAFLASVHDELSRLADADEVLHAVGTRLGAHLHVGSVSFVDVDESALEQLTVSHTWSAAGAPSLRGRFRIEDFLQEDFARACRAGETTVVRDTFADPRTDGASYARHGVRAFIVVPFHRDGAWKFHMAVSDGAARDWRDDEVALIEEVLRRTFPRLERARAEAELRASEARLRLALDVAELGTWTWDLTSGAGTLDARAAEMIGASAGPVADVAAMQLATIHPDDREGVQAVAAAGVASGQSFDLHYRVVLPDGRVRHIASRAHVLTDASGGGTRLVGTNRDVTLEHEAARERDQLLASAEAANRAKSEFLAVMSHELRTPLNAIGGYAELIELGIHGPVTDAQRTALDRIQASQRHLLGLISGVLDYSRVEAGAVTYRMAEVPVAEAVAAAETLVAPQLRARGLEYVWSGAPAGLRVRADPEKLQQILLNLLGNAVKFTHARDGVPGRIEVWGAAEPGARDGAGDRVLIHVRDSGEGIAPSERERVFEPFVQADQRLTRSHPGVGLGLAISRDLARGMGGDLTLESAPGVGSTFTLALPRG